MKTRISTAVFLVFFSIPLFSDDLLDQAIELIQNNRLEEAKPILQTGIDTGKKDERYFQYLGYIYEYEGRYEQAISVLQKGLKIGEQRKQAGQGNSVDIFYHNLGNNYYSMEDYKNAETMYTRAIEDNYGFAESYKKRAMVRTLLGRNYLSMQDYPNGKTMYSEAIDDAEKYLLFRSEAPDKETVIAWIATLKAAIVNADAEVEAEKQRQQALLDAILNSLQNASEDTQNISAGSEDIIIEDEDDDELAD